ncbi:MAG: hypothetical protein JG776_2447 [Caloramator sp.]|jgi:ATP-dependent DNA helicase RecQ|uniref:RecQ family ATP-dependent DNA helicase n=1 Tax=Caloramator sp. TaxID=1871330 RepID=UPI001DF87C9E|nr:RecQ family ATP-dependent DNA helicase [Caloramator sp.]MBZ4664723.1 hypothetical protein [Caloramator sp.]
MEKYTANYVYTNHNFVIQNLTNSRKERNKYYPAYCVIKNILHRGCPTIMSQYLQEVIGPLHNLQEFDKRIVLIDSKPPVWYKTIKGNDEKNDYPAKYFFEEILPNYLEEYKFVQQLMVPEVLFSEITDEINQEFVDQQVDFYLPQAKLVIEINGQQHLEEINKINDKNRKEYLAKFGIETIEINTTELRNNNIQHKIDKIKSRLKQFDKILNYYKENYYNQQNYKEEYTKKALLATAVMRFQTLILELLQREILKLDDKIWSFNILSLDVDKDFAKIALEDIFIWLENICKLMKLQFNKPDVRIVYSNESEFQFKEGYINVNFSLLRRWTDENEKYPEIIFVRTDYFDKANYFEVNTTDPIKYKIINDGEESDIPALKFFLKNIFGFDEFNDGQLPIIINALSCNDTIGLLPTGSGKSLCYQLAALLQPCVSFVVCPIKSLMYDQKDNLDKRYIDRTNYISSDQDAETKSKIGKEFSEGKYFFIWISPERFQIQEFRDYLDKLNKEQTIAIAVIDEVHCLSEWGHDFRTSYLNLIRTIRKYCPSSWLLGLTATASSFVLEDLKKEFEIGNDSIKTLTSFTRPELNFIVHKHESEEIEDKKNILIDLLNNLNREKDIFKIDGLNTKSGLIFTLLKNGKIGCYSIANELSRIFNIDARWYSGEVPQIKGIPVLDSDEFDKYKMRVQKEYKENKFPLLVATKAFGMGIDKSNIRYTIHFGLPASLEALYQEAGRAGRDKKKADCYVLYTRENIEKNELEKLFNPQTKIEEIKEIQQKYGFKGKDVLRIFFLWLSNNKGTDEEFKEVMSIFENFAEPGTIKNIECRKIGKFADVQKAIYRLSLVKIIDDWTIESWNKGREIIKVYFSDYTEQTAEEALLYYIRRYDKEFSLDLNKVNNEKYSKYIKIYNSNILSKYEKIFNILIEWIYDNIVYSRRQAIKNILELCDNFKDSKSFKEEIERYFKFTESTYLLDYIAQNPLDHKSWFEVFYTYTQDKRNKILIDIEEIKNVKGNLTRLLESYRYNTGLNFLSGILRLILGEFENQDGRIRLELAMKEISQYEKDKKYEILSEIFKIKELFNEKSRIELSKMLIDVYPEKLEKIYIELKDYYSLNKIIEISVEKLKRIGETING